MQCRISVTLNLCQRISDGKKKKKKKKKRKKIATKNKRDSNYVRVHFPTFSHATNYDATLPIQLDLCTHNFWKLQQSNLLIHFFPHIDNLTVSTSTKEDSLLFNTCLQTKEYRFTYVLCNSHLTPIPVYSWPKCQRSCQRCNLDMVYLMTSEIDPVKLGKYFKYFAFLIWWRLLDCIRVPD